MNLFVQWMVVVWPRKTIELKLKYCLSLSNILCLRKTIKNFSCFLIAKNWTLIDIDIKNAKIFRVRYDFILKIHWKVLYQLKNATCIAYLIKNIAKLINNMWTTIAHTHIKLTNTSLQTCLVFIKFESITVFYFLI